MMRHFPLFILLLVGLTSVQAAVPEYVATEFERANKLYEQGHFTEAAAAYGNLTKAGAQSSAVWFNLGNAAYKSGQIGSSLFAYRMAERQSPRDTALRANLQFVREKAYSGERARVPFWTSVVRLATIDEWALLSTGFLWAFFGVLIFGQVKGRRFPMTIVAMFCLFAISALGVGLALRDRTSPQAIVVAREATVRRGPYEESPSVFELRDGAELKIVSLKNDWVEIRDLEKRTGWIRRDTLTLFPVATGSRGSGLVGGPLS